MTFGDIKTVGELLLVLNQFNPELNVKVSKDGNCSDIWKVEEAENDSQWSNSNIVKLLI